MQVHCLMGKVSFIEWGDSVLDSGCFTTMSDTHPVGVLLAEVLGTGSIARSPAAKAVVDSYWYLSAAAALNDPWLAHFV